ncbi:MAG: hypothetical protein KatS3mg068_1313 [Candidatus Sericytochromatia bacterium]|nr:MAG: hypothetical protein KatS3mg068_1313 [Candidatus Sericytochromatia bacterium]
MNNKVRYTLLFLIIVALIFLISKVFKSDGIISGYVYSTQNPDVPLTNVLITIDDKKTIPNNQLTGAYILQNIKKGEHTLKFTKQEFKDEIKVIEVKSGESIKLNVYLKPKDEIKKISSNSIVTANIGGNTISIIDYNTRKVTYSIESGIKPYDIKIFSDRKLAFVSNFGENTISVINLDKYSVEKKIQFDAGSQITKLEKDNYNLYLYALLSGKSKIALINTRDYKISKEVISSNPIIDFEIDKSNGDIIVLTDRSLDLYNSSGNLIKTINLLQSSNSAMKDIIPYSYNELIILTSSNPIKINVSTEEVTILPIENITAGIFNNNSSIFYALKENKLLIYDYPTFELKKFIELNLPRPNKLKFSPYNQELLISSDIANFIQVFNTSSETLEANFDAFITISSFDFI